jgi:hypothetical protein
MSLLLWLVQFSFVCLLVLHTDFVFALTPEEVLKLKAAGVSEETIQMMLKKEQDAQIPAAMREQGYATEHMGTWELPNGHTITSTGKRRQPPPYSTAYPYQTPYAPDIYPYLAVPAPGGHHPFPPSSSHPTPHQPHTPPAPRSPR